MGANGALSAIATLTAVYPNCYLYFPAGKAFSGSAAGWYYAVMSSGTAGTVYNNTYTTGTPTIPASPTAIADAGPGAYTQTSGSGIDAYKLVIPGNTLGINDRLRFTASILQVSNANATKLCSHIMGATTFRNPALTVSVLNFNDEFELVAQGSQSAQTVTPAAATDALAFGGVNTTPTLYTLDFTASQTFKVTLQITTVATDYVGIESLLVERIPGVA